MRRLTRISPAIIWLTLVLVPVITQVACSNRAKEPTGPTLEILYNAEEESTEKSSVAQLIQAQCREHGISVKLDPASSTIYNDRIARGDFQSALTLWYLDYNDPEGFLTDFYSKAGYRLSKYSSNDYDEAYLQGLLAPNEESKIEHFKAAAQILSTDVPWIPLYSNDELFLLKSEAAGFSSNAYQYYDYRRVGLSNIRTASDVEVQTLDPAQAYDLASKHVVTQSYEGLVTMDTSLHIVPALASSWHFSKNNDTLTFVLRPHVLFHSAPIFTDSRQREMSAADVKFSFERMLKSNSPYTYIFDYVKSVNEFKSGKAKDVSGFHVVDRSTFVIELSRPFPTMLPWLLAPAAYILPKELPDKFDFSRGSVGTGPFVLKTFDGAVAQFDANSDYWLADSDGRHLPLAKFLSIRVIKDVNTLLTAFRRGDLDILNIPLALYNDVLTSDGKLKSEWTAYESREVTLNNLKFIAFNTQRGPWGTHIELRRKVEAAIDQRVIVEQLFRGKARAASSVIPQGVAGFN